MSSRNLIYVLNQGQGLEGLSFGLWCDDFEFDS